MILVALMLATITPMLSILYGRTVQERSFATIANMICNSVRESGETRPDQALAKALQLMRDVELKAEPSIRIAGSPTGGDNVIRKLILYRHQCELMSAQAKLEFTFPDQPFDWPNLLFLWLISIPAAGLFQWFVRWRLEEMQKEAVSTMEFVIAERLGIEFTGKKYDPAQGGVISRLIDSKIPLLDDLKRYMTSQNAKIRANSYKLLEAKSRAEIGEFAAEVAHNILIPIEVISKELEKPGRQRNADDAAVISSMQTLKERVRNITERYNAVVTPRTRKEVKKEVFKLELVSQQTEIAVSQIKRLWPEIDFEFTNKADPELPVKMNAGLFQGVVTNILKNAIEAMQGAGKITILIERIQRNVKLSISDNGPGISEEVAGSLFSKGITSKEAGSGLGLYSAKETIKAFAGDIRVFSPTGRGATFEITLPGVWVKPGAVEIFYSASTEVVVLDDDQWTHYSWSGLLEKLAPGVKVHDFFTTTEFREWFQKTKPGGNVIFLIDQEIKEGNRTPLGLDLIAELKIAPFSYLVTGLAQEKEIKVRAKALGVPVMDKLAITQTKFVLQEDMSAITHVLIDDDPANHRLWTSHAKDHNVLPKTFMSVEEFEKVHRLLNRSVEVYVDLYWGSDALGGEIARKVRALGFSNVKIASAAHMMLDDKFEGEFDVVSKFQPFMAEV
jgi:signal transduction histidine kinase